MRKARMFSVSDGSMLIVPTTKGSIPRRHRRADLPSSLLCFSQTHFETATQETGSSPCIGILLTQLVDRSHRNRHIGNIRANMDPVLIEFSHIMPNQRVQHSNNTEKFATHKTNARTNRTKFDVYSISRSAASARDCPARGLSTATFRWARARSGINSRVPDQALARRYELR